MRIQNDSGKIKDIRPENLAPYLAQGYKPMVDDPTPPVVPVAVVAPAPVAPIVPPAPKRGKKGK